MHRGTSYALGYSMYIYAVADTLLFIGGAKTQWGSGGVAPRFFLVATPFKLSENMGNASFDVFVIYVKIRKCS